MDIENIKAIVAKKAADFVEDGMFIGLGTGSTVKHLIKELGLRCKNGLKIRAVASSIQTQQLADAVNIPIIDISIAPSLDITLDGADEIDGNKWMIKGGGGALLREKIVAQMSQEMIVMVDETKLVQKLGRDKLPVEIIPFGYQSTLNLIHQKGYYGALRTVNDSIYKTDNGNYIFDVNLSLTKKCPREDHLTLIQLVGVIDTGFFFDLAGRVVVGYNTGYVKII